MAKEDQKTTKEEQKKITEEAIESDEIEEAFIGSHEKYTSFQNIDAKNYRSNAKYIDKVAGAPFKYDSSDVSDRVYSETLGADAPLVSILPGLPNIFGGKAEGKELSVPKLLSNPSSIMDIFNEHQIDVAEEDDLRFYTFEEKRNEYIRYVGEMLVHVMSMLGIEDTDNPVEMYEMYNLAGPTFYFDKASTITESIDNTYDKPMFAGMTEQFNDVSKDLAVLMDSTAQKINENSDELSSKAQTSKDGLTGKLQTILSESSNSFLKGSNMLFPKIWKDSGFRKSYNLQFKFRSIWKS